MKEDYSENTLKSIIIEITYAENPNIRFFYFEQKTVWKKTVKRSKPKVKLPSKRKEHAQGQCPPSFLKAEKAEAEKISPEKWQSELRAGGFSPLSQERLSASVPLSS